MQTHILPSPLNNIVFSPKQSEPQTHTIPDTSKPNSMLFQQPATPEESPTFKPATPPTPPMIKRNTPAELRQYKLYSRDMKLQYSLPTHAIEQETQGSRACVQADGGIPVWARQAEASIDERPLHFVCATYNQTGRCPSGADCSDIHVHTNKRTVTSVPVHVNRTEALTLHDTMNASLGTMTVHERSTGGSASYAMERILCTKGSDDWLLGTHTNCRVYHCKHFHHLGLCTKARDCTFIHVVGARAAHTMQSVANHHVRPKKETPTSPKSNTTPPAMPMMQPTASMQVPTPSSMVMSPMMYNPQSTPMMMVPNHAMPMSMYPQAMHMQPTMMAPSSTPMMVMMNPTPSPQYVMVPNQSMNQMGHPLFPMMFPMMGGMMSSAMMPTTATSSNPSIMQSPQ